ncbi:MAG: hypothetical protein FJ246_01310 [Nitrospira sp.]|nr:hypothetical protein [Nitrospira sp.]
MNKLIGVIDETGTREMSNSKGFGIGAILFQENKTNLLAKTAKEIAKLTGNHDFKYKHVQNNSQAREQFIRTLRTDGVHIYGFYSSESGMTQRIARFNEAATRYGRVMLGKDNSPNEVPLSMDLFLGFAMLSISCHTLVNGYTTKLYWDRRNDLDQIKRSVEKHIEKCKTNPRLTEADKVVRFAGQVTGTLYGVARLAGILAGDLRRFFDLHGQKIWKHLDPNGLRMQTDPYGGHRLTNSSPLVATKHEPLADLDPYGASENAVMLQAYYQRFLRHPETKRRLVSFCDPHGHMGLLEIEHGRLWHIRQSAD